MKCTEAKTFFEKLFADHCYHEDEKEYPKVHGDGSTTMHRRYFWYICCWCKKEKNQSPPG